jgi:hypothetical protein
MENPVIIPDPPSDVMAASPPRVLVGGVERPDLYARTWQWLPAPAFGRADIVLHPAGDFAARIESASALPAPGSAVLLQATDGTGNEMPAIVESHEAVVEEDHEQVALVVRHELASLLARPLLGRRQWQDAALLPLPDAPLRFNASPQTRATPDARDVSGYAAPAFDASADAVPWTPAGALAYLLATAVDDNVAKPTFAALQALCDDAELPAIDLTGIPTSAALVRIAREAGLVARAAVNGLGIVFHRPGAGLARNAALQPAGSPLDTTRTDLHRARVVVRGGIGRGVVATGAPTRYESTFDLQPGWDPAKETDCWRDLVRALAEDWPAVADVYRKWVLNEHGRYSGPPLNLPAADLAGQLGSGFTLRRPRRLEPCLSTDLCAQSLGIVVEVRIGYGQPWRRWAGSVWAAAEECTIWLAGDALPGDYFRAATAGDVQVRVTGTVASDTLLKATVAGANPVSLDASARCGRDAVHASSIFCGAAGLGTPLERDDAALLQSLAERAAEADPAARSEAELTLGWVDGSRRLGDVVERIEGRGLILPGGADVRRVRHDHDACLTTLTAGGAR